MTRDDIIRMASDAGIDVHKDTLCRYETWEEPMIKFANLVAAAEREACAKVCDGWPDYNVQGLAEAIRARGQHD